MIYGQDFYETLLDEFLRESYLLFQPTDKQLARLPDWDTNIFQALIDNIEMYQAEDDDLDNYDSSWVEWRQHMLKQIQDDLQTKFHIFGEQLYLKGYTTPGGITAELSQMIYNAKKYLPHDFRIMLQHLSYSAYDNGSGETIFVWIVFVKEELIV